MKLSLTNWVISFIIFGWTGQNLMFVKSCESSLKYPNKILLEFFVWRAGYWILCLYSIVFGLFITGKMFFSSIMFLNMSFKIKVFCSIKKSYSQFWTWQLPQALNNGQNGLILFLLSKPTYTERFKIVKENGSSFASNGYLKAVVLKMQSYDQQQQQHH